MVKVIATAELHVAATSGCDPATIPETTAAVFPGAGAASTKNVHSELGHQAIALGLVGDGPAAHPYQSSGICGSGAVRRDRRIGALGRGDEDPGR